MNVNTIDIIIIFAYLLGMLAVGFIVRKRAGNSTENYLLAGKGLGFGMMFPCMAAVMIGGGSTLGAARYGYETGFGASWYLIWQGIGLIILGLFLAKKLMKLNITTVSELLSLRFGEISRVYSAVIMVVYETMLAVSQVISIGTVLSTLTGLDIRWAMIVGGGIALIYSYVGGMVAITMTDFMQWILMTAGIFIILLPFSITKGGGIGNIVSSLPESYWDFGSIGLIDEILPKFLLFTLGIMIGQELWQRMFTARDLKTARIGTVAAGGYALLYGLACVFIGMIAVVVIPGNADTQSTFVLMVIEAVPVGLSGLIFAGVLSALMSTLSGPLLASATLIVNDIYLPIKKSEISDEKKMKIVKLIMGCLCIFVMIAAFFIQDLLVALDMAYAILSGGLFIPIVCALVWKRATTKGALASMMISTIIIVITLFVFGFTSYIPILIGFVVSVIVFTVVSLATPKQENNKIEELLSADN